MMRWRSSLSGFNKKDFNQRMYKLRDTVVGPKIKAQEPMAINDPVTKELITDSEEKKKSIFRT